jgi:hypothetical protein
MAWFHGGYWALWYLVFTAIFCYLYPSHDAPWMLALACFLFIPCMLLGCYGGVVARLIPSTTDAAVAAALDRGAITRRFVFAVGAINGVLALAGVVLVWLLAIPYRTSQWSVLFVLFGSPTVATAVPFLGVRFLKKRCPTVPPEGDPTPALP